MARIATLTRRLTFTNKRECSERIEQNQKNAQIIFNKVKADYGISDANTIRIERFLKKTVEIQKLIDTL